MPQPIVEQVRTIPLQVHYDTDYIPTSVDHDDDTGFPFDNRDRDDSFRSQLDDIAKRHPQFAEHLGSFPFRSSRSQQRTEDPDFRRFDRPFGSRLEGFGFPFSREFDDEFDEADFHPQRKHSHTEAQQQPQERGEPTASCSRSHSQEETCQKPPQAPERGRKIHNIQQSNTVDLGQKQEPVNERSQRSMSAPPPDNRPRFVSSINIPINRESGGGDMGSQQSQPESKPTGTPNKPTERVIPIHVEGRDEPVIPKNVHQNFSSSNQSYAQPQSERIFGHRPGHFTQYVNPPRQFSSNWQPGSDVYGPSADDMMRQQHYQKQEPAFQQHHVPPQHQAPPPQAPTQQVPPQQQQPAPPQHHQQDPSQPQQPEVAKPQQKPSTPIDQIQAIQKDVSQLMLQVEQFSGKPKDKQYLYLDEMLTRNLLKLDNIDTQGQENIRSARKEAIKCIEKILGVLETKAAANVAQSEDVTETKAEEQETKAEVQPMETDDSNDKPAELMETVPEQPKAEQPSSEKADLPSSDVQIAESQSNTEAEESKDAAAAPPMEEPKPTTEENKSVLEEDKKSEEIKKSETDEKSEEIMKSEETMKSEENKKPEEESSEKQETTTSETQENVSKSEESTEVESKPEDKKEKKKTKKKVEKK